MTARDVLSVLGRLDAVGVPVWIDGGWGVDALLGRQTRVHDDLDLAVDREELELIRATLAELGFEHAAEVEPGLPARLVLRDGHRRQVDIHPLRFDEHGNGIQDLGRGQTGTYPAAGLTGVGSIGGVRVRCLTPELHRAFQAGFEPVARHRRDVALLTEHFDLDPILDHEARGRRGPPGFSYRLIRLVGDEASGEQSGPLSV